MSNSNIANFVNRLVEEGMSQVKPVTNPVVKYVKAAGNGTLSVSDNAPVSTERDKRSLGSPAPAPVSPKPRITKTVEADNGQKDFQLELNNQTILSGVIMSEVLGRPKCFRSGRRPVQK